MDEERLRAKISKDSESKPRISLDFDLQRIGSSVAVCWRRSWAVTIEKSICHWGELGKIPMFGDILDQPCVVPCRMLIVNNYFGFVISWFCEHELIISNCDWNRWIEHWRWKGSKLNTTIVMKRRRGLPKLSKSPTIDGFVKLNFRSGPKRRPLIVIELQMTVVDASQLKRGEEYILTLPHNFDISNNLIIMVGFPQFSKDCGSR